MSWASSQGQRYLQHHPSDVGRDHTQWHRLPPAKYRERPHASVQRHGALPGRLPHRVQLGHGLIPPRDHELDGFYRLWVHPKQLLLRALPATTVVQFSPPGLQRDHLLERGTGLLHVAIRHLSGSVIGREQLISSEVLFDEGGQVLEGWEVSSPCPEEAKGANDEKGGAEEEA